MKPFLAASIQFNPKVNERDDNIHQLFELVKKAAMSGAKLIVTPEMATTGYYYRDREAISAFIDTIPGYTTAIFEQIAEKHQVYIAIGLPEVDEVSGIYYNSAAFIGPSGYIGKYRKIHLWECESHWAASGDMGFPVFDTAIGKLSINICMDAVYSESARIAAIQGANILMFLTNSSAQTIALLQARAEMNGMYIVSANRSNTEKAFHMVGASAIWSPTGEKICEAPYLPTSESDENEPRIVYGEINPFQYHNESRRRLCERRPALYQDIILSISPWDSTVDTTSRHIVAAALQYTPVPFDKDENIKKISAQFSRLGKGVQLVVLPELSLTGPVADQSIETVCHLSDSRSSPYLAKLRNLAKVHQTYLVFGYIEQDGGQLYNSSALVSPDGDIIGRYRKTHLHPDETNWAKPGNRVPIFETPLGRIGILIGYEAAFPELSSVLAVHRADILAIPSCWRGEFGRDILAPEQHAKNKYPKGAMSVWGAVAASVQAYTVVSNFVGKGFLGRSALYTLDPVYGLDQAVVASENMEETMVCQFSTKHLDWWFNQEKLICSRMTAFYKPLVLNV